MADKRDLHDVMKDRAAREQRKIIAAPIYKINRKIFTGQFHGFEAL